MKAFIICLTAALALMAGITRKGAGEMVGGQHFRGQMVHSMGMMSNIMKDMHQVGSMNPRGITDMINITCILPQIGLIKGRRKMQV